MAAKSWNIKPIYLFKTIHLESSFYLHWWFLVFFFYLPVRKTKSFIHFFHCFFKLRNKRTSLTWDEVKCTKTNFIFHKINTNLSRTIPCSTENKTRTRANKQNNPDINRSTSEIRKIFLKCSSQNDLIVKPFKTCYHQKTTRALWNGTRPKLVCRIMLSRFPPKFGVHRNEIVADF